MAKLTLEERAALVRQYRPGEVSMGEPFEAVQGGALVGVALLAEGEGEGAGAGWLKRFRWSISIRAT